MNMNMNTSLLIFLGRDTLLLRFPNEQSSAFYKLYIKIYLSNKNIMFIFIN